MNSARSRSVNTPPTSIKPEIVDLVWERARVTAEADPAMWRLDPCGAWIRRDQFNRDDAEFGWRVEQVAPAGASDSAHLRAFHRRNHFHVANNQARCTVMADRASAPAGEYVSPPRNREV